MAINLITKSLIGVQDMLIGIGSVQQTRGGSPITVDRIDLIKPLPTTADLITLDMTNTDLFYSSVITMGAVTIGDGGGLVWWFDSAESIASNNGTTIIAGNGLAVGCWKVAQ